MNPLAEILRDEIRRCGAISFQRFMDAALYHPQHGYYRKPHDPFGKSGDFYTAEQLQPVFGILIAARIRSWFEAMGRPEAFTVVELGAGRGEMEPALAEWPYIKVELDGAMPERFRGVVFSNEFFDALPVDVAKIVDGVPRQLCVGIEDDRFMWAIGDPVNAEIEAYLRAYFPGRDDSRIFEINLAALRWMERIAGALESGYVFTIDYGYTTAESVRFPQGTLMSYRRHNAREDVLQAPGERDITAHVCFTALERHGEQCGLHAEAFESLAQTLLRAGEPDEFAAVLAGATPQEEFRRRMQLKTLLFGMGETFRTLLQRKGPK